MVLRVEKPTGEKLLGIAAGVEKQEGSATWRVWMARGFKESAVAPVPNGEWGRPGRQSSQQERNNLALSSCGGKEALDHGQANWGRCRRRWVDGCCKRREFAERRATVTAAVTVTSEEGQAAVNAQAENRYRVLVRLHVAIRWEGAWGCGLWSLAGPQSLQGDGDLEARLRSSQWRPDEALACGDSYALLGGCLLGTC